MKTLLAYVAIAVGAVWLLGWCLWAAMAAGNLISDERFRLSVFHEFVSLKQFRFIDGNLIAYVAGFSSIYMGVLLLTWGIRHRRMPVLYDGPSGEVLSKDGRTKVSLNCILTRGVAVLKGAISGFAHVTLVSFCAVVIIAVCVNYASELRQFLKDPFGFVFNTHTSGPVGMDDTGRYWLCRHFGDFGLRADSGFVLRCEGRHVDTIVVQLTDKYSGAEDGISTSRRIETISAAMRGPYDRRVLDGVVERLALTGDRAGWQRDRMISKEEFLSKLDKLGMRTAGDFYAACGFTRFEVRDQNRTRLSIAFSAAAVGRNPVMIEPK